MLDTPQTVSFLRAKSNPSRRSPEKGMYTSKSSLARIVATKRETDSRSQFRTSVRYNERKTIGDFQTCTHVGTHGIHSCRPSLADTFHASKNRERGFIFNRGSSKVVNGENKKKTSRRFKQATNLYERKESIFFSGVYTINQLFFVLRAHLRKRHGSKEALLIWHH